MPAYATFQAPASSGILDDPERLASFGRALDGVRARIEDELGDEDLQRVRSLNRFSRTMEVLGRVVIHFSIGPVSFLAGVSALWVHKQLQATELGHPILHGSYDRIEGAERFHAKNWYWDVPIDEEAWHEGHNLRHHPYTNVHGRDPDVRFGPVRLNESVPYRWYHRFQLPFTLFYMWPGFAAGMNLHFTGVADLLRPPERRDFLEERTWSSARGALRKAFRKYIPYYSKEFVLFPALAGPFFWKVLLGNWLAETGRDIYSAASIFCGHIGPEVEHYPEGTRARGRGAWYAMQVQSTRNFEVPYAVSVLCGGLDRQIEHHLFPRLPPERLREISAEVRQICEDHGVRYQTSSWGRVLGDAMGEIWRLSWPTPAERAESLAGAA